MTKHDVLEAALTGLSKLQIQLVAKGGPTEDGELFDEIISLQDRILKSLGLPPSEEHEKLLWLGDGVPTRLEVEERVKQLYELAQEYFLSPVKSDVEILKNAQEYNRSAFNILPELGITTHTYTIFVYEKILLTKSDRVENVLAELRKVNQSRVLSTLGELAVGNIENADAVIASLKSFGLKYIDDFVKTFPRKETRKEANLLFEFWSDINGGYEFKTLDDRFEMHASYLMNYLCLVVNEHAYRITECEIYYHDADNHPDPYVHKRKQQLYAGNWYFNDMGIDITFGNFDKKIYASILIRGIRNLQTNRYISGTSNVLREIFDKLGDIITGNQRLCLREVSPDVMKHNEPVESVRIGLSRKEEDTQNFINKPYRFIVELIPAHKFSNKETVVKQLLIENKISKEEAKNILGYNVKL